MKTMHKLISTAVAAGALTVASGSAQAWSTSMTDIDFEWYANVGKPIGATVEVIPAARPGYIWSPGHWENRASGSGQVWVNGHYVKDDFEQQIATYADAPFVEALPVADSAPQ